MTKWAELQRLNDLNKDRYILDLFDETRAADYSILTDGMLFDYSKTGIDAAARDALRGGRHAVRPAQSCHAPGRRGAALGWARQAHAVWVARAVHGAPLKEGPGVGGGMPAARGLQKRAAQAVL